MAKILRPNQIEEITDEICCYDGQTEGPYATDTDVKLCNRQGPLHSLADHSFAAYVKNPVRVWPGRDAGFHYTQPKFFTCAAATRPCCY